jgi:hypothetical protein
VNDTDVVINNEGVAKGGSGISINSSEDEDDEQYNIKKPMKCNAIEEDEIQYINPTNADISSKVNTTSEELLDKVTVPKTTSLRKLPTRNLIRKSNKDNEDIYLRNIKSDLLFYKNNKSDFVWDGRYGLGRKYSPKRSITVP